MRPHFQRMLFSSSFLSLEDTNTSKFLSKGVRIKCPVTGKFVSAHDSNTPHYSTLLKMSLPSKCTWRDRALRDVSFEKR